MKKKKKPRIDVKYNNSQIGQSLESKDDFLSSLPNDLKRLLRDQFLSCNSIFSLAKTSKSFRHLIVEESEKSKKTYNDQLDLHRRLLSHAALGEWDKAKEIWSKYPSLLTCPGTVYHPNLTYSENQIPVPIPADQNPGRYKYVNCTAWQIALMNEEFDIAEEMAKSMDTEEKKKQFDEIFPNGIIKHNWDLKKAIELLREVFDKVIQDSSINENNLDMMNKSTKDALDKLYAYVKPAPEQQKGLVFDAKIYVEALKLFDEKLFSKFQNWDQRSFWCIRVEEHLASLLGTGYLRPHAQGIFNNLDQTKGCSLADNSSYFAFRRGFNSIPAYHFFVGVSGGRAGRSSRAASDFSKLRASKYDSMDRIYAAYGLPQIGVPHYLK